MPRLIRLYIDSVMIGFAIATGFVALLLWHDVAGLGSLIRASDMALSATLLLIFQHGTVFSSMQFAFAVMSLADDAGPRGGRRRPVRPVPIRIAVRASR